MDLNEKDIDDFMTLVYEAQRIEKELAIKNKVKEIKTDFE